MIAGLRRMPAPLLVAMLGTLLLALIGIVHGLRLGDSSDLGGAEVWATFYSGIGFAFDVLVLVGLLWLVSRLTGRARTGVRIALVATALQLALVLAQLGIMTYEMVRLEFSQTVWYVTGTAGSIVGIVFAVGLGIATRRWYWIVLGAIVALFAHPPWFIAQPLYGAFEDSLRGMVLMMHGLTFLFSLTTCVMAALACRDAAPSAETSPARGLARIPFALYGLVIATAPLVGCLVVVGLSRHPDHGIVAMYRTVSPFATAFHAACLVVLALVALAAVRGSSDLPRWWVVASATAALWVAGSTLQRVAELVHHFFGDRETGWERHNWSLPDQPIFAPVTAVQLVTALAIGGLLVAIAIAARRRALETLRARTVMHTGVSLGLALAGIAAQELVGPASELTPYAALILLGSAAALVASWLIAAGVARQAATELAGGPGLPAAKLVSG